MKQLLVVLFVAVIQLPVFAQNNGKLELSGTVEDQDGQPLTSATVMLMQAADSVLTSFATSDKEGKFLLRKVTGGEYLLKTTYLGFATDTRNITVGEQSQDIGSIVMQPASEVLNEVEVKADFVPLRISKDTIEYNAEAFKTQPNAAVEDLLKKLPGVEVDNDGNIQAQGEDVQKVLVDGKEFFGDDPKMATKNLPADAVDKVQVYDKMSDMAEFSGIDDGERQKTINLQLREDKKKGLFGNTEAGYGTDDHYSAKLSINRFSKASQLSVLGMANNVNQQGFSVNEYMNFAGGAQAFSRGGGGAMSIRMGGDNIVPISNGLSDGLARTLAGGLNYNVEIGKKFDLRTNYFYNNINNTVTQNIFRQNFAGETFETNSNGEAKTDSKGHRFNVIAEYDIDSTQNIELRTSGGFSKGANEQLDSSFSTLGESMDLRNSSITDYMSVSDQFNFTGDLYYRKRFGEKRGRILTANMGLNTRQNDTDGDLFSLNKFYESGDENLLDQHQVQKGDFTYWYGRLSYTEPIGRNKWLEANYRYQKHDDDSDKDIFDIDPNTGIPDLNDTLSIAYTRDLSFHRGGLTFRMNTLKSSLSIGLQYQATDLEGFINTNENPIAKTFNSLLPSVNYRLELASARSLRLEYTTSIDVPEIEQLSPIIDNSDPLRLYLGNPNLKAEYMHRARLMFHSFSQFSSTAIFGMLSGTYTKNRIITSKSINSDLVELQIPVNIDGDWRGTAYGSYSTPLKFMRTRIRLNGRVNYQNSKIFINTVNGGGSNFEESGVQRWDETLGLSFQNMNSDVFEFDLGGNWTFNNTLYASDSEVDQSFFSHNYYLDFTLNFLKNWSFNTTFDINFYTGEQFADNQVVPLWSASVSRFVFKDKRGEIKLSVFDILNENRGINRTSTSNYIQEIRSNSLSQYFMLSFVYSIKGYGQGAMPDMHMGRRMR